jgi:hypothetical protein
MTARVTFTFPVPDEDKESATAAAYKEVFDRFFEEACPHLDQCCNDEGLTGVDPSGVQVSLEVL